jgi:hypothetical protein
MASECAVLSNEFQAQAGTVSGNQNETKVIEIPNG